MFITNYINVLLIISNHVTISIWVWTHGQLMIEFNVIFVLVILPLQNNNIYIYIYIYIYVTYILLQMIPLIYNISSVYISTITKFNIPLGPFSNEE